MFLWSLLFVLLHFLSFIFQPSTPTYDLEVLEGIQVAVCSFNEDRLMKEILYRNETVRNLSVREFSEWIRQKSSLTIDEENGQFIWGNSRELENLCEKFNHRETRFNFVYKPKQYGLGNKLYSVITTILMSLTVNRNYYIYYPQYNEIFDNCFPPYNDSLKNPGVYVPKLYGHQYDCGRIFMYRVLPYLLVVDTDYLYYPAWLKCNRNDRSFFSTQNRTLNDWDITQKILQLFLNPRKEIRDIIRLSEKILFHRTHRIGIQLRLGGQHAATQENFVGIPFDRLPEVADQISEKIYSLHFPLNDTVIYVSSDSIDSVIELRRLLDKSLLVVDFPLFAYGHSDVNVNKEQSHIEVVNRILADFYFLTKSDFIFVTWQSSLGRLMCNMKNKKDCGKVLNLNKVSKF